MKTTAEIFGELRSLFAGPKLKHQFHRIQRLVHQATPQEQKDLLIPYCLDQLKDWPLESRVACFKGSQKPHPRDALATTWEVRNLHMCKTFIRDTLKAFGDYDPRARVKRLRIYATDITESELIDLLLLPILSSVEEIRLQDNDLKLVPNMEEPHLNASVLPNLKTLYLRENYVGTTRLLQMIRGVTTPCIENLTFSGEMSPNVSLFHWLAAKPIAPTLRHLSLALHPVSAQDLAPLLDSPHLKGLETLSLTPLHTGSSDILQRISQSPNFSPSVREHYAELSAERERVGAYS